VDADQSLACGTLDHGFARVRCDDWSPAIPGSEALAAAHWYGHETVVDFAVAE
jgi:hypothetical protein